MSVQPVIDLEFPIRGRALPVDHGYALYSACCNPLPFLHADKDTGVHPVQGSYNGGENVLVTRQSRLAFRIKADRVGDYLPLAGKQLEVSGCPVTVGVPNLRLLRPAASLQARTVTIAGFKEEGPFLEALYRQLKPMAPEAKATLLKRRTITVAGKQIVGFKVLVENLSAEESLALQEHGLGGRRRFGCGLFVPLKR